MTDYILTNFNSKQAVLQFFTLKVKVKHVGDLKVEEIKKMYTVPSMGLCSIKFKLMTFSKCRLSFSNYHIKYLILTL